jgi:uncharacterized protein (UPF0332 family)
MHNGGISIVFSWHDYLELARELGAASDSEAKMRSSISRAYYASYCNARNYMIDHDHNIIPKGESVHQYVIEYFWGFRRESIKTRKRKEIGIVLDRMKRRRVNADYENHFPVGNLTMLNSETRAALSESERILSIIAAGGI